MGDVATCIWTFVCKRSEKGEEVCEPENSWKIKSAEDLERAIERQRKENWEPVRGLELDTLRELRRSKTPPPAPLLSIAETAEEEETMRGRRYNMQS